MRRLPETLPLLLLLVLCNAGLLWGQLAEPLVFYPGGEFWRIFTHAFTHVSGYHFLIDASLFLWLYHSLETERLGFRLTYLFASLFCSLAGACFHPEISTIGFCGLSGVAHGILAVRCLECLPRKGLSRIVGASALTLLFAKVLAEVALQQVVFGGAHPGYIGTPLVGCHLGGMLGGLGSYLLLRITSCKSTHQYSTSPSA
jgi:rhomboid family GlyGly-CTERM serine protease